MVWTRPANALDIPFQLAIRDLIRPLVREDGSTIIRQSAIADAAHVGDRTVRLVDPTNWQRGMPLRFVDDLEPETFYITRIDPADTMNLNFGGLGYAGLQAEHPVGSVAYTNLFGFAPWDIVPQVTGADPVVFVQVVRFPTGAEGIPGVLVSTMFVHIQYHRMLGRSNEDTQAGLNSNNWAERQEYDGRGDLSIINDELLRNQDLTHVSPGAVSVQMSRLNSGVGSDMTVVDWGREEVAVDVYHWVGTIDCIYAAKLRRYG